MGEFIFIILMFICFGLFYMVHRYFGKHEFYLLTIVYSILGFVLSFKLVNIFGLNINLGIIFTSGILFLLYYFINRFGDREPRKYIITVMVSTLFTELIMIVNALMVPSIYDKGLGLLQNMFFDNYIIFILYPVVLFGILLLSNYSFNELKFEEKDRIIKTILTIAGIVFIEMALFMYFSYAVILRFNISLMIALDNYFINTNIMILYYLCGNRIMKMKKVKS